MATMDANDFGAQTYWNRPTGIRPTGARYVSKYGALKTKTGRLKGISTPPGGTRPRPPSPALSQQSRAPSLQIGPSSSHTPSLGHFNAPPQIKSPQSLQHESKTISRTEEDDAKDEKAIQKVMKGKLPEFSDEKDWEAAIFELQLVLDRVWPHKDRMDIMDYLTNAYYRPSSRDMELRADNLIYYILTTSARRDSYAKLQILAACHKDAVPCVMVNEGKKKFNSFKASSP
jgi:hypothetical protein